MAGRVHEYSIRIKGILDSSVAGALERMQSMMNRMQRTQQAYNNANRQANELRPYLKSLQAMQKQIESIQKAKSKLGELSNAIRQSQQNLNQLTAQRIQAMQRVQDFERQRNSSRERLNQTRSEQESLKNRQNAIKENIRNLRTEPRNDANRESIRRLTLELTELQRKSRELSETRKSQSSEATRYNSQYINSVRELERIQRQINTQTNRTTNMHERYRMQIEAIQRLRSSLSEAGVDVNRLAEAEARLRQQIEQTNNQMNQQTARQNRLNQAQSRFDQASFNANNAYSNFQGAVSTANTILNPFREAVMTSAGFEKEMSKVKAISGASDSEMVALTAKAREVGRTSQFKASETASAEYYMALAGWTPEQMIAALPSLTDLAAAADIGIQRASDVITDEMTAFRIDTSEAKNVQTFVDQFVQTTRRANTDAEQLHEAMKYAAPVMQTIGMTTAETFAFAGSMANSGIKGSMAGTSMRAIGLRIGGGAKNAKKAADAMGISLSDAQAQQMEAQLEMQRLLGTERSKELNSIEDEGTRVFETMRSISEAFKGMSESEQVTSAGMLFGVPATSGGLAVLKDFQSGAMDKLHGQIKGSEGAAAETARTMNENLLGDIMRYESAMESLSITFSNTFDPIVSTAYQTMTEYATKIEEWVQNHQELAKNIAIAAAGFSALIVAGTGLFAAFTGIQYISSGIGLIATKITMLPNIFSVAASGIRGAFLSLAGLSLPVLAGLTLLAGAAYLIYDNWETIGPIFESTFADIQTVISGAMETLGPAIESMSTGFEQIQSQLAETDFSTITNTMEKIALFLAGLVASLGVIGATIIAIFVELGAAIIDTLGVAFQTISMMIDGDFTGAFNFAVEHIKSIISGLASSMLSTLSTAFKAVSGIVSSIGSAMDNVGVKEVRGGGLAQVAHNAAGGIYSKGAFLTTFAEDSAEAAIPLDGSSRAISLWQQAGQILGVYSSNSASDLSQNANSVNQNAGQILGVYSSNSASDLSQNANSVNQNAGQILGEYTKSNNTNIELGMPMNAVNAINSALSTVYANIVGTVSNTSGIGTSILDQVYANAMNTLNRINTNVIDIMSREEAGSVRTATSDLLMSNMSTNTMNQSPINISFTINGNADSDILNQSANQIVDAIQQTFEEQYLAYMHERSRVAFT